MQKIASKPTKKTKAMSKAPTRTKTPQKTHPKLDPRPASGESPKKIGKKIAANSQAQERRRNADQNKKLDSCIREVSPFLENPLTSQEATEAIKVMETLKTHPAGKDKLNAIRECKTRIARWVTLNTAAPAIPAEPTPAPEVPVATSPEPLAEPAHEESAEPAEPGVIPPTVSGEHESSSPLAEIVLEDGKPSPIFQGAVDGLLARTQELKKQAEFLTSNGVAFPKAEETTLLNLEEMLVEGTILNVSETQAELDRLELVIQNASQPAKKPTLSEKWFHFKMRLLIFLLLPEKQWPKAKAFLQQETKDGNYPAEGVENLQKLSESLEK